MKTLFPFLLCLFLMVGLEAQVTTFGTNAGTLGTRSSYFGESAGKNSLAASAHNTYAGYNAGTSDNNSKYNSFYGSGAGAKQTAGNNNTFLGYESGYTGGENNTCVGVQCGYGLNGSRENSYFGVRAGYSNSGGNANVGMGNGAGQSQKTSDGNTFLGFQAAGKLESGGNNVALGIRSGFGKGSGHYNVMLGAESGLNSGSASSNVFIGYRAGYSVTSSNKLYIENSDRIIPLIYGDFRADQVGINTNVVPAGYTLAVDGKVIAEEVRVQLSANWPDYVFDPSYDLMSIAELKKFITEHKHLPEVPSAEELAEEGGVDVGEMNKLLLKKVEELSLYIIQLQEEVEILKQQ